MSPCPTSNPFWHIECDVWVPAGMRPVTSFSEGEVTVTAEGEQTVSQWLASKIGQMFHIVSYSLPSYLRPPFSLRRIGHRQKTAEVQISAEQCHPLMRERLQGGLSYIYWNPEFKIPGIGQAKSVGAIPSQLDVFPKTDKKCYVHFKAWAPKGYRLWNNQLDINSTGMSYHISDPLSVADCLKLVIGKMAQRIWKGESLKKSLAHIGHKYHQWNSIKLPTELHTSSVYMESVRNRGSIFWRRMDFPIWDIQIEWKSASDNRSTSV